MINGLNPDTIEAVLPQTQCELCQYPGCRPYAEAIAKGEASIDLCLPGGVQTLQDLATLTHQDPSPMLADMRKRTKTPSKVVIKEEACIGCTKCIAACPVDAIIGAGKAMHTIITDHCTGCDLCIPPCPTDCIEVIPSPNLDQAQKHEQAQLAKQRFDQRNRRLAQKKRQAKKQYQTMKNHGQQDGKKIKQRRLKEIQDALVREQARRDALAKENT